MPDSPFAATIEDLSVPTPFFAVSRERLRAAAARFQSAFPDALIQYALKANSEPEVLKEFLDAGLGFEAASAYELRYLVEAGVPGDRIIYGTSVKPVAHIREFVAHGADRFAFDSLPELEKIAAAAPGARVYVRVTANDAGSVFQFSEKFGTDRAHAVPYLARARELGLVPYGISFHVGSQAGNPDAWSEAIAELQAPIEELQRLGITLEVLNIGGGFPQAYASLETAPALEDIAESVRRATAALPYPLRLMLEPGRALVADSAVMVGSVIGRVERPGATWLFLDAGVYNGLFETMAYQGSTRYRVSSVRSSGDAGEQLFALAGPTGDSPDVITREALLPQDIGAGDRVVFHDVGAYSMACMSTFNGFPRTDVRLV